MQVISVCINFLGWVHIVMRLPGNIEHYVFPLSLLLFVAYQIMTSARATRARTTLCPVSTKPTLTHVYAPFNGKATTVK